MNYLDVGIPSLYNATPPMMKQSYKLERSDWHWFANAEFNVQWLILFWKLFFQKHKFYGILTCFKAFLFLCFKGVFKFLKVLILKINF
jgi:hypothetical protein